MNVAMVNLCTAAGPAIIAIMCGLPAAILTCQTTPGERNFFNEVWEKLGVEIGTQPTWAPRKVLTTWTDDTADNIVQAFLDWKQINEARQAA